MRFFAEKLPEEDVADTKITIVETERHRKERELGQSALLYERCGKRGRRKQLGELALRESDKRRLTRGPREGMGGGKSALGRGGGRMLVREAA